MEDCWPYCKLVTGVGLSARAAFVEVECLPAALQFASVQGVQTALSGVQALFGSLLR